MATQKLCPRGPRPQAAFLLRLDLVVFRVVGTAVDSEGPAVAVAGSGEVSAEVTEDMAAAEEAELGTKVAVLLPEEEELVGHLMGLVMAHYPLPTHLRGLVEIVEALGLVGMVVHLSAVARTVPVLQRTGSMVPAVGMEIQDAMAHMTIDPLTVEVAAADTAIEEIAALEASQVAIASR